MTKVKNKGVIRRLAFREFRKSGKMNCIVIFSIILTCVLFAALASIGGAILNGIQNENMRLVGGKSMAGIKFCLEEDYEKIRSDLATKDVTYRVIIGRVVNEEFSDLNIELNHAGSDLEAKKSFCFPETGRLPEAEDEIAVSTLMLDRLGLPYETGIKVPVVLNIDDVISEHEFTLCGFWEGDSASPAQQAWASRAFVDKYVPKPQISFYEQYKNADYTGTKYAGYMMVNFDYLNSFNIEGKTDKLITRLYGSKENAPYVGVNWAYQASRMDSDTVIGYAMFVILIFAAGYLIIYNIFRINISVNIRSYGLLKTIGTTSKQIRRMVKIQALIYSVIGIPFGICGGVLLGKSLIGFITATLNIGNPENYTVSSEILLPVCIFAALFTFATVMISCLGPCREAGNVSPIEALRFNETSINIKKEQKKTKKITPVSLALSNMARNRKKSAVVVLSLSLSLIILNAVFTMLKSMSFDPELTGDFVISRKLNDSMSVSYEEKMQIVKPEMLEYLENTDGISEMNTVYFANSLISLSGESRKKFYTLAEKYAETDKYGIFDTAAEHGVYTTLYGVTEGVMNHLDLYEGEIDIEKWKTGKYAVVHTEYTVLGDEKNTEDDLFRPGDKVSFEIPDYETGKTVTREYEVMAIGKIPDDLGTRSTGIFDSVVIIPDSEYFGAVDNRNALSVMINAEEGRYDEVSAKLSSAAESDSDIYLQSIESMRAEFEEYTKMIKIVGGSLCTILGLIGILNFINSVVTGIVSRKRELAVMNAVGMTGKQLSSMLMWEGISYAVLTALASVILGTPVCCAVFNFIITKEESFLKYFSLTPVLVCVPLLLIFAAVIPTTAYRILCKESVVERLREN